MFLFAACLGIAACTSNKEDQDSSEIISDKVYLRFFIEDTVKSNRVALHFLDELASKKIIAYVDEDLKTPIDFVVFMRDHTRTDTILSVNQTTGAVLDTTYKITTFGPNKIAGYKILANLIQGKNGKVAFNNKAIAPLEDIYSDGAIIGQTSSFWLKYADFGQ